MQPTKNSAARTKNSNRDVLNSLAHDVFTRDGALADRIDEFRRSHPMRPHRIQIVRIAIVEYLDRNEKAHEGPQL